MGTLSGGRQQTAPADLTLGLSSRCLLSDPVRLYEAIVHHAGSLLHCRRWKTVVVPASRRQRWCRALTTRQVDCAPPDLLGTECLLAVSRSLCHRRTVW